MTADDNFQRCSVEVGAAYHRQIVGLVNDSGWVVLGEKIRHISGIEIDILCQDLAAQKVAVECKGGDRDRPGLRRSDNIWKVLGQALVLHNWNRGQPQADRLRFLVITSAQPNDDEPLAAPLRAAEREGQMTIVVEPSASPPEPETEPGMSE